jgi:hypothetical protein
MVRPDVALQTPDNQDALRRAVQSGLGNLTFKRH